MSREEIVYVPIKKELLEQMQKLSESTSEIYESQSYENFVNNILVTEKFRLMRIEMKKLGLEHYFDEVYPFVLDKFKD